MGLLSSRGFLSSWGFLSSSGLLLFLFLGVLLSAHHCLASVASWATLFTRRNQGRLGYRFPLGFLLNGHGCSRGNQSLESRQLDFVEALLGSVLGRLLPGLTELLLGSEDLALEGVELPERGQSAVVGVLLEGCLLYTSPSPRDGLLSRMPSSA